MKTRYVTGRYFEGLTKNWLERNGYYVMRSAGSKGIFDLAVFPLINSQDILLERHNPFLIQMKAIDFNTLMLGNTLQNYLNSKELNRFRECNFHYLDNGTDTPKKYLIIYNTRSQKDLPIIYSYENYKWLRVDTTGVEQGDHPEASSPEPLRGLGDFGVK